MPLDAVVEFKRGVYEMALTELSRYLPRFDVRTRYLRQGARLRDHDHDSAHDLLISAAFELPPGATYEPDPGNQSLPNIPPNTHAN